MNENVAGASSHRWISVAAAFSRRVIFKSEDVHAGSVFAFVVPRSVEEGLA